jgi:hypothetical protein
VIRWPFFTCDEEHLNSFIQAYHQQKHRFKGKKKKKKKHLVRERPSESNKYRERTGEGRIVVFVIEANKICEAKTKGSYLASVVVLPYRNKYAILQQPKIIW